MNFCKTRPLPSCSPRGFLSVRVRPWPPPSCMALESIVTHPGPGTTFTLPLASPALTHSPTSTPSSTLNSPLPINTIQLRRSSYGGVAYHARSPFPVDSPERSHKELAEKHSELAESLKRSVTIVLWYKVRIVVLMHFRLGCARISPHN